MEPTPLLSRGGVGCAGHGGTALGARRDGHVTVAAAEPPSLLNGGVLAHANTACSHSHQNMSFNEYSTRILGATLGGVGAAGELSGTDSKMQHIHGNVSEYISVSICILSGRLLIYVL